MNNKFITFTCIGAGILGLILFVFGSQFNGTMSDEIQEAGMVGMGICALWLIINRVDAVIRQKELENM